MGVQGLSVSLLLYIAAAGAGGAGGGAAGLLLVGGAALLPVSSLLLLLLLLLPCCLLLLLALAHWPSSRPALPSPTPLCACVSLEQLDSWIRKGHWTVLRCKRKQTQ